MTLLKLLLLDQSWEVVADNLGFADAPCTDADGNFFYSDMKAPAIYKLSVADGKRTEVAKEAVSGLKFGPDGLLYGCQGAKKRVVSIDLSSGAVKEIATNVAPNDLAVSSDGFIYITETQPQRITRISIRTGEVTPVDTGITKPNGIALEQGVKLSTVRTQIGAIRDKTGADSITELLRFVAALPPMVGALRN